MNGSVPLALALLIAGVGVGIVAVVVGTARVTELRRLVHDRRQRH
jgi:putative membrane protein